MEKAKQPGSNSVLKPKVLELVEESLFRRFSNFTREEIVTMFHLANIRDTRIWKEARDEGREEGETLAIRKLVQRWIIEGKSEKEIASLMGVSLREVRRLAKDTAE